MSLIWSRLNVMCRSSAVVCVGLFLLFPAWGDVPALPGQNPRGPLAHHWPEVDARLKPYEGEHQAGADPSTLTGKVMCGYQGWFFAPGDGTGFGWKHYGNKVFKPGSSTVDLWPDMSELGPDEQFPTEFKYPDGKLATVFSSYNPKTVDRHFQWMADYGIDGVFLQRFATEIKNPTSCDAVNGVMDNVRTAANRHGRTWTLMYDLSGLKAGETQVVIDDWKKLVDKMQITKDPALQHHQGKPVIALWGIGFDDKRQYSLEECGKLIEFFKNDPVYGNNIVMVGVPFGWRDQVRDTVKDAQLHDIIAKADIISPWSVSRYGTKEKFAKDMTNFQVPDIAWCQEKHLEYMPVIFAGFQWNNLRKERNLPVSPVIPRGDGSFFWKQGVDLMQAGAGMIYVAMFDEIDEGTAIFKCTNQPPEGFGTFDGMPSDEYLYLTGQLSDMLKKKKPFSDQVPKR